MKPHSAQQSAPSYGSDYKMLPVTSIASGAGVEVTPDVYCHTLQIVNICLIGNPSSGEFVLVDAGMPGSAAHLLDAVAERFGENARPQAIILTHGHFDHVGSVIELVTKWKVPVYAHQAELPFLTGQQSYPAPDPAVEGGLVAKMSFAFPIQPIQLGNLVQPLPADGSVPGLPGFRWLHTPGHTPGHISLFRQQDRTLIAGDAFVTVKQDSLYKVFTQERELNGPPRYFTPDWQAAWASVKKLAALQPEAAVTGHGVPVFGEWLREHLDQLATNFEQIAIPDYGKYIH